MAVDHCAFEAQLRNATIQFLCRLAGVGSGRELLGGRQVDARAYLGDDGRPNCDPQRDRRIDITLYGPNHELHSGHYGNWEVGAVFIRRIVKIPFAIIAMAEDNPTVNRLRHEIRAAVGADTIEARAVILATGSRVKSLPGLTPSCTRPLSTPGRWRG
jgi:hypothetical protein